MILSRICVLCTTVIINKTSANEDKMLYFMLITLRQLIINFITKAYKLYETDFPSSISFDIIINYIDFRWLSSIKRFCNIIIVHTTNHNASLPWRKFWCPCRCWSCCRFVCKFEVHWVMDRHKRLVHQGWGRLISTSPFSNPSYVYVHKNSITSFSFFFPFIFSKSNNIIL